MTATTATSATAMQNKPRPWWLTLISGILLVIVGAVMLWAKPSTKWDAYSFIVIFLGFYWLVEGIFDIVFMFVDHTAWGWKLFIGIVSILAGSAILRYPLAAGISLPKIFVLVLGIWGLMYGIILLIMAFQGGGWGAGILGALGIIFGIALMVNYASVGMGLAMLWTAAVFALIGGFVMIVQSFRMRSA